MQVNSLNCNYRTKSYPSFGMMLPAKSVLEVTTQKILGTDGIFGIRDVVLALNPSIANRIGSRGYMGHAKIVGEKLLEKYPVLREPTLLINNAYSAETKNTEVFQNLVETLCDSLGKSIDICL